MTSVARKLRALPSPMLVKVFERVRDAARRPDRRGPKRLTCGVIGSTACQPDAGDPLGVEVESDLDVAARGLSEAELREECAAQMDRLAAGLFGGKDEVERDLLGGGGRRGRRDGKQAARTDGKRDEQTPQHDLPLPVAIWRESLTHRRSSQARLRGVVFSTEPTNCGSVHGLS